MIHSCFCTFILKELIVLINVTHHKNPHLDDLLAEKLLRIYADKKNFPKKICIGMGGGEFDDHSPQNTGPNGEKIKSATMLVAKRLGIDENPELSQILDYANATDLHPAGSAFELASVVNLVSRQIGTEAAYQIVSDFVDAKIIEQRGYLDALDQYKQVKISEIDLGSSKVKIAGIKTENEQILKAARHLFTKLPSDILIVFRESGHVQIFKIDNNSQINFTEIIKRLRIAEFKKRSTILTEKLLKSVGNFGTISEKDCWCYPFESAILNGSFSRPDTTPTKLNNQEIYKAILEAIRASF